MSHISASIGKPTSRLDMRKLFRVCLLHRSELVKIGDVMINILLILKPRQ